jgi:hypothetical protein
MTPRFRVPPSALRAFALGSGLLLLPHEAAAQGRPWPGRAVVSVNGGIQPTSTTFADRFSFDLYQEQATVDADYRVRSAPVFDGGVIIRLWRGLGAGVAVSRFTDRRDAQIEASLPHPFFDEQHRQIEGQERVRRNETGVHVQAAWMIQATNTLRVIVAAGPSYVSAEQSFATDVRFSEEYPFDAAEYAGAAVGRETKSAVGFNAGADIMWTFSRHVGVGGLLRFTRASMTVTPGGRSIELEAGGLHAGGGLRVLF